MSKQEDQNDEVEQSNVYGIAAMSLLEAIILTLQAKGLLQTDEIDDAFDAAISAHRHNHEDHTASENDVAATILNRIRVEGNSVRLDL
ncbi:hypothetical protein [Tritonibacter mobilis]|uniref:hypothetical protein n=1 Tax=Tritonibacter mobilis TaxID=379347 RepID=UPI000806B77A|nr:hypothetical protein [Tritonibacter mobilis]GLP85709.1 hypothetical protein GCM10007921_12690 [Tritonibacter mobilis]SDX85280.1 hypothetical protein SAMN05444385_11520 [Tritonibacter mobilis]